MQLELRKNKRKLRRLNVSDKSEWPKMMLIERREHKMKKMKEKDSVFLDWQSMKNLKESERLKLLNKNLRD